MEWTRILAYITGSVDRELLLRNEYLAAEQLRSLEPRETPTIPGLLRSCRDLSATRPDTTRHSVCVTPALPRLGQFRARRFSMARDVRSQGTI